MNPQATVAIILALVVVIAVTGTVHKAVFIHSGQLAPHLAEHWKTIFSIIIGGLVAYIGVSNK